MGFEDVPIWLGDMISSFPAIESGKLKRAIDEHIGRHQFEVFHNARSIKAHIQLDDGDDG
jgi:hypothetical protein